MLQLRARVQWLSEYINRNLIVSYHGGRIEDVETGLDLVSILSSQPRPSPRDASGLPPQTQNQSENNPLSSDFTQRIQLDGVLSSSYVGAGQTVFDEASSTDPGSTGATGSHIGYPHSTGTRDSAVIGQSLPRDAAARRFVDAYFRNVNRAYPFVNQSSILENLERVGDFVQRLRDSQSTLLYLVMSIGCTTLERAGQIPRDTAKRFEVSYAEIIQECVCRNGIESVQILMLLALYSLFDPAGASAYAIVGIAARQAITVGLTRRPADETAYSPAEAELRNRLHWSIFALDRMMAISHGLPVALTDENADIPLPGLTIDEFASGERTTFARKLQTSRHVIQLRQIEGRILQEVHLRNQSDIAQLASSDRRAILSNLRGSVEDWYSRGCLMSPMEADSATVHSSVTWLSARYYYLLILLYYPNHFNSSARAVSRQDLLLFAQRQLQSTSVLYQQRQLPLNCNTLYRLMPVCLILMHDFVVTCRSADWTTQSTTFPFQARDEVAVLLSVLEAFPEQWDVAHRAAQMVGQFAGVISGGEAAFFSDDTMFPLGTTAGTENLAVDGNNGVGGRVDSRKNSIPLLMKPLIAKFNTLMQEMLGTSTCFQFVEYPADDHEHFKGSGVAGAAMSQQQPIQQYHRQQAPPPVVRQMMVDPTEIEGIPRPSGGDHEDIGYGWGTLDLDFL